MCEHAYELTQAASGMSFETAITIVLAALGAILTALAIIIGIAAIWGWGGIKDAAAKAATDAINAKMQEYPDPSTMLELVKRMEEIVGRWDAIQTTVVTDSSAKAVANASNIGVQQEGSVPPPYPKKKEV